MKNLLCRSNCSYPRCFIEGKDKVSINSRGLNIKMFTNTYFLKQNFLVGGGGWYFQKGGGEDFLDTFKTDIKLEGVTDWHKLLWGNILCLRAYSHQLELKYFSKQQNYFVNFTEW